MDEPVLAWQEVVVARSRSTARVRVLALTAMIGLGATAAILLPRGFRASPPTGAPTDVQIFQAVCVATDRATRGLYKEAHRIFVNQAHEGLHQMAIALGEVDRPAQARLLEAKARVEASGTTFTFATIDALVQLRNNIAGALSTLTQAPPPQC